MITNKKQYEQTQHWSDIIPLGIGRWHRTVLHTCYKTNNGIW